MNQAATPERLFTKPDSSMMKRTPLGVISFTDNKKSALGHVEPGILCKKIDNSTNFVDLSQQNPGTNKFTPLAIPLDFAKKKPNQTNQQARITSTEPAEFVPKLSFIESIQIRTEASEYIKPSQNLRENKENKDRGLGYAKSLSQGKKKEKIEKKAAQTKEIQAKTSIGFKERIKSPKASKKIVNEHIQIKKKDSHPTSSKKNNVEGLEQRFSTNQRMLQKIIQPTSNKKVLNKPGKNERSKSIKMQTEKTEKTEKSVQKDSYNKETSAMLDEFVKHNAAKILEQLKEQKRQEEFERRLADERRIALEEGNRRIREANFKRFNLQSRPGARQKEKVAWGVDQRKFSRPQHESPTHSKNAKPKIDEDERRKRIGLGDLNEDQLAELKRRTLMSFKDDLDRSQDFNKQKRQLTSEEHEHLQKYMIEKKIRMDQESQMKKMEDEYDYEKKRRNLEKLFDDIRNRRSQVIKTKKKGKKRSKKKKANNEISISRIPPAITEPNDKHYGTQDSEEEENYSLLYDEYKKIIKSKRSNKDEGQSNKKFLGTAQTHQSPQDLITSQDEKFFSSQHLRNDNFEIKKEEYKKKYNELSNRFQKNLVNSIQMLENPLNRSSKNEPRSESKEERGSEHHRGTYKGRQILENERNEAQKVIMEMETDNFSENDYLRSDSLVINSEDQNQRLHHYHRGGLQESERQSSTPDQSLPENSAREIIEAAAIFIQKNYRGYRTRKILREIFDQIYPNEYDSEENEQENDHNERGEEEDYEEEDFREQQGFRGASSSEKYNQKLRENKHQRNSEDEEEEFEEGEGEIIGADEDDYEFLGDDEKQSLRSLLEKQKLGIYEQYNNEEEDQISEQIENAGPGDDNYRRLKDQYQQFYEEGDLKDHEENNQIEYLHQEGEDNQESGFGKPMPRRTKSDGEIILKFELDDSEDDNNISLHGEGEEYYDALDKKKFYFDKPEIQGGYLEGMVKGEREGSSGNKPSGHHQEKEYSEEGQEGYEEEEDYEGEDDEDYDPRYDPLFQQKYFQMYGKKYEGEEDDEYQGESGHEEEGYIHESDYDAEYGQEIDENHYRRENQRIMAGNKKPLEKGGRYKEEGDEEEIDMGHEEHEDYEHEEIHDEANSAHMEHGDDQDQEEQRRFFSQQNANREGDHEKMVMISTINSEDSEGVGHHHETPNVQLNKNIANRRHKSDIIMQRPESEFQSVSMKENEERRSHPYSQKSGQVETSSSRLSQHEDFTRLQKSQKRSESSQVEDQSSERKALENEQKNLGDQNDNHTDSEYFREELIHELSQIQGKDNQEIEERQEEENKIEGEISKVSNQDLLPQNEEQFNKTQKTSQSEDLISQQRALEINQKYQTEIQKLKEEEARKWNEMVSQLSRLQGVDLSSDIKAFIQNLQKQSEQNKMVLVDNVEGAQRISESSPERKLMDLIEGNYKHGQQVLSVPPQTSFQSPQDMKELLVPDVTPVYYKKLEVPSPLQEGKYNKRKKPYGFTKKTNLQIDINAANEDSNEAENAGLNLDLSQMRLVLGSEQLLREQSARTLSQSVSAQSEGDSIDDAAAENIENAGLFERDPFKEFTRRKFKELMQHENMRNLILMREQALEIRHKTHLEHMKKMLENRRFSPRTFQNKQIELEKWITKERENIQRTKKDIEKGWLSTADSIQRTQRDLQFLQKILATEGRNTNTSDLSLRNSFTDEEIGENAETQSERLSKRSFLNMGNEIRSPSSSKNIKIIDKFELKDHLFSPQLNASAPSKKDGADEIKIEGEREHKGPENRNLLEAMKSSSQDELEVEEVDKDDAAELQETQPSSAKKSFEQRVGPEIMTNHQYEQSKLRELVGEDVIFNTKSARTLLQEKRDQIRRESPIKIEQSEDVEINSEELIDEEIEWENEVLGSPQITEEKIERKEPSPKKFGSQGRKDLLSPVGAEHIASTSSIYSPKSSEEIRHMIQEKISSYKSPKAQNEPIILEDIEPKEIEPERYSVEHSEEDNIQAKTDFICKEIVEELFENFAEEMTRPDKERIRDKIAQLSEEPPVMHMNLHNLIENNYFFNAGVDHPNFQANIPMPLSPSLDPMKHQNVSPAREHEMTPEKQILDAQAELLRTLGIKTDITTVTQYVNYIFEEINSSYKEVFLRNINTPLGFSTSEKLNNMRNYDLGSSEGSSLAMSSVDSQLILEIHLYFKVEERIMAENPDRNEVSTELVHIHNKMLFDCINEIFDSFRPYGLNGQPFPWKVGSKAIKSQAITEQNLEKTLEKVKTKVLEWASYLCGYYGEGDEFIIDKNQSFVDEYLAQVREERILRMLSEEIFEMENKWITYDDEEAEVELEIADMVFDKLVTETADLIAQIYEKKRGGGSPGRKFGVSPGIRKPNTRIGYAEMTKIDNDLNVNSV